MAYSFLKIFSFLILVISISYRIFAPHFNIQNSNGETHQSFILENIFPIEDFRTLQNYAKNIEFELTIKVDSTIEDNYGSSD